MEADEEGFYYKLFVEDFIDKDDPQRLVVRICLPLF